VLRAAIIRGLYHPNLAQIWRLVGSWSAALKIVRRPMLWLVAAATAVAGAAGSLVLAQSAERAEPRAVSPRGPLAPTEQARVSLFEASAPSVAYITTLQVRGVSMFGQAQVAQGAGSGFVWDTLGHVVTNNHVVQGANQVAVQLDAGDPIEADIVGRAPEYDLAVVRLKRPPKNLRPIPIGTSKDLKVGQQVIAIGNPFGLQRTLTEGIVSALERELPTEGFREVAGVIQTDAAINPGNSGGPLLDSAGRLIGVNTAIHSASGSSAGVGFAIPVDLVNRVVPSLIARGYAPLPGIGIQPFPPELVARAGITGVLIASVTRGSPAADAGLRPANPRANDAGDVIVAVNGRRVQSVTGFASELDRIGVDNVAELTVVRDGKERKVPVRVVDVGPRRPVR
jgi:2-alkenal reductase